MAKANMQSQPEKISEARAGKNTGAGGAGGARGATLASAAVAPAVAAPNASSLAAPIAPAPVIAPALASSLASLGKLTDLLPSPLKPLHGLMAPPFAAPNNLVCFSRHNAGDLNRPYRGRALHHRFVLMLALETGATVRVDYREVNLDENHGLIVFPFQFHDYTEPATERLKWLFITFELPNEGALASMRYRTFEITPEIRSAAAELVAAYLAADGAPEANLMVAMRLSVLLLCIRRMSPVARKEAAPVSFEAGLATRVNQLAEERTEMPTAKEIAAALGISTSYLQARFQESCGVSLGRHLRRLRLEKACGLLRLSTQRVSDIADVCGFSSVYAFSRAFRTLYGLSPLQYRKGGDVRIKLGAAGAGE